MKELAVFWFSILRNAVRYWLGSNAFVFAAALAFFTLFSIAPVMIIVVTIVGFVFGEDAAKGQIAHELEQVIGPRAADAVQTAVANIHIDQSGFLPTLIGIGIMVFGATTVFAQLQLSLNSIWRVVPKPSRSSIRAYAKNRLLSLTIVVVIGFVMLMSLLLSVVLRALMSAANTWLPMPGMVMVGLGQMISLGVITLLFAAMFRVLPDVVLRWRDVLLGAFVTALLFGLGRFLIAFYLAKTATASTYGAAGSLVLLLLWVHYSSLILLFGAALIRAYLQARGITVSPRASAVFVHYQLEEEPPVP